MQAIMNFRQRQAVEVVFERMEQKDPEEFMQQKRERWLMSL